MGGLIVFIGLYIECEWVSNSQQLRKIEGPQRNRGLHFYLRFKGQKIGQKNCQDSTKFDTLAWLAFVKL